ncbi:MAG: helix-turn-helix transcriptional regulator, partial [Selenomonadaceae bacterium]|nr:helix-turn-helix transcriptional regulator [Selenomonadaceae bacterium]
MDILQQELANTIGINVSVLSRIENGTRPVRDDELIKIAD